MDAETFIDANEVVADSEDEMENFPGAQVYDQHSSSDVTVIAY